MPKQIIFLTFFIFSLSACRPEPLESDINPLYNTEMLIENGGRVSWYQGMSHSKVLFDRISKPISANTDLYMMESDGTDISCLTCEIEELTNRFTGQPVWHPDGIHCVIQVENENSRHTRFEHVSFGINNDLWFLNTNTLAAEKIFETALNDAALHPQFNPEGDKLIFARRTATGESLSELQGITPGGENHWDGWSIQINEFDINEIGLNKITDFENLNPNGEGFYETHSIDENIVYSFTADGQPYVNDCHTMDLDGNNVNNLINSQTTWEEHATYSPSKENFIFISSRHDEEWSYPESDNRSINTELFMQNNTNGGIEQITNFNTTQDDFRILTSDFDWSNDGTMIIFLVAKIHKTNPLLTENEIWKLEFDEAK